MTTRTAVPTKVCATDPHGNECEVNGAAAGGGDRHTAASACCPDVRTVMEAMGRGDLAGAKAAFDKAGGTAACPCLANR